MLKIIKSGCEYNIPSDKIVAVQEAYDGFIVTVNDGTEIRFEMQLNPGVRSLLPIVQNSSTKNNVVFNVDNIFRGKLNEAVQIS